MDTSEDVNLFKNSLAVISQAFLVLKHGCDKSQKRASDNLQ